MNFSERGIAALKYVEGCVKRGDLHVIYDDATGRPIPPGAIMPRGATIGYGHLVRPGDDYTRGLTEQQATALLRVDIAAAERAVRCAIKAPINQHQYDALVLLAYNIGAGAFSASTVVKYLNNPDFVSAQYPNLQSAWMAWNRAQGVVSEGLSHRRRQEWDMFAHGIYAGMA